MDQQQESVRISGKTSRPSGTGRPPSMPTRSARYCRERRRQQEREDQVKEQDLTADATTSSGDRTHKQQAEGPANPAQHRSQSEASQHRPITGPPPVREVCGATRPPARGQSPAATVGPAPRARTGPRQVVNIPGPKPPDEKRPTATGRSRGRSRPQHSQAHEHPQRRARLDLAPEPIPRYPPTVMPILVLATVASYQLAAM